ncbi:MAG: hypothetical protein RL261_2357, partial [Pseudomonadota bacterium]
MPVWTCAPCRPLIAAIAAVGLVPCAHGVEYTVGEGKLTVTGSTYVGTAIRTDDRDPKLLANFNSALLGIAGNAVTPSSGRNGDDGNLNFGSGDPVITVLKGYLGLAYKWRDYGIEASGQAWYDYATADSSHPWGNAQNGYVGGEPLSDRGALARSQFSGVVLDNLYG